MADEAGARIPRLAAGCDASALALSPAQGFLLSRIDGVTSWKHLREIGGLSPEQVDAQLEQWLADGIVELAGALRRPHAPRKVVPGEIDENELDPALEIDLETQRRILDFETRLGADYHELLGVARDADARQIKKAYFKLSKEFHPDRYFRREIGGHAARLERIFKRVLEAYELLSDPTVRAEVEKSMSAAAAQQADAAPAPPPDPAAPPRALTKLERLRARMPFRIPESLLAERRQRARDFWDAAQLELGRDRFIEAAAKIRLAIAFDPFEARYRDAFGSVQARAAELRAEQLIDQADAASGEGMSDARRLKEVLRLYEEALLYRPHQPDLNDKAARAAIACGAFDLADEYVGTALDHSPDVARYHVTQALVHRARGNQGHALRALERALEIDSSDQEAARLRLAMRRTPRASAG